jgi:hypothetical protein
MMRDTRYWGLFWISTGLAAHAFVVGRQLESTFFMMMFFWGFVAVSALRGSLEIAQAMSVVMVLVLGGMTVAPMLGHGAPPSLAYTTFALYPAIVSWISVFFYIRYLRRRDGGALGRSPLWR